MVGARVTAYARKNRDFEADAIEIWMRAKLADKVGCRWGIVDPPQPAPTGPMPRDRRRLADLRTRLRYGI